MVDINESNFDQRTALHLAAVEGHLDAVTVLVEELKAQINPIDRWGSTPLDEAQRFKQNAVAKYLTLKGGQKGRVTVAPLLFRP